MWSTSIDSATSQVFVQAIGFRAGGERGGTVLLTSTTRCMPSVPGKALAAVYIPQNLERDLLNGRRPQIVIFFNKQFFTPGNVASSSLQAAVSAAVAQLPTSAAGSAFAPVRSSSSSMCSPTRR